MNKKGNMYNWITKTWNPIRGKCGHECIYCYAKHSRVKRLYEGKPFLIEYPFKPLGSGHFIFVCSMTDIMNSDVHGDWIEKIMQHCQCYDNQYLFQSKDPMRFQLFMDDFPERIILGTTIESNRANEYSKAPSIYHRMNGLRTLSDCGYETMISIEPIIDFDLPEMIEIIKTAKPWFVSIGADSKRNYLPEPSKEKTETLISELSTFTNVKIKENLRRILNGY